MAGLCSEWYHAEDIFSRLGTQLTHWVIFSVYHGVILYSETSIGWDMFSFLGKSRVAIPFSNESQRAWYIYVK